MTTNKKQVPMRGVKTKDDIYNLFKIVDKLEQRIATLEKVLASHAKCIGEMREDKEDKELQEDYLAGKFDE